MTLYRDESEISNLSTAQEVALAVLSIPSSLLSMVGASWSNPNAIVRLNWQRVPSLSPEVERSAVEPGVVVSGPAAIVENETTTIVTSGYTVTGQGDGSLLLQRKEAA